MFPTNQFVDYRQLAGITHARRTPEMATDVRKLPFSCAQDKAGPSKLRME